MELENREGHGAGPSHLGGGLVAAAAGHKPEQQCGGEALAGIKRSRGGGAERLGCWSLGRRSAEKQEAGHRRSRNGRTAVRCRGRRIGARATALGLPAPRAAALVRCRRGRPPPAGFASGGDLKAARSGRKGWGISVD